MLVLILVLSVLRVASFNWCKLCLTRPAARRAARPGCNSPTHIHPYLGSFIRGQAGGAGAARRSRDGLESKKPEHCWTHKFPHGAADDFILYAMARICHPPRTAKSNFASRGPRGCPWRLRTHLLKSLLVSHTTACGPSAPRRTDRQTHEWLPRDATAISLTQACTSDRTVDPT